MRHQVDVVVRSEMYPPEHPLRTTGAATTRVIIEAATPLGAFYLRTLGLRKSADGAVRVACVHPYLTGAHLTRWLRARGNYVGVRVVAVARRGVA